MKPSPLIHSFRLIIALVACLGYAAAAPYGPQGHETRWVQPNGIELDLHVFGDDYYARTETADGYTVVFNSADNAYYYAVLSPEGTTFISTGIKAGGKIPAGLAKHLVLPPSEIRKISAANRTAFDGGREARWKNRVQATEKLRAAARNEVALGTDEAAQANIQAAPVVGDIKGLTILVQFPNDPITPVNDPVNFPVFQQKINRYCNQADYKEDGNTGSVYDYFKDQSLGKLNYTQIVTEIITMPEPRNYYNFSDYPTNSKFRQDASRVLTADAINVLRARGFDFTALSTDTEGRAFATNIIFAGRTSGVWAQGLWPQQWNFEIPLQVGTEASPVSIFNFQMTNLQNTAPTIGTFCHENGHLILDYPDLYDIEGEGVGEHCLMGSGNHLNNGRTPSPLNAYFKDIVGWANVTDLTTRDYETISLPTTGNIAYRIRKPASRTEYFIVENRGAGDKWAVFSRDKGIAIWHIDERKDGNLRSTGHYGVSLEQADGKRDLEVGRNRGDSGDLFDLNTPLFSDKTTPAANWWDGNSSSVQVKVLSEVGREMDVLFGISPPDTIAVESPNGGEVIYPGVDFTITWTATIFGNVRIELYKSGVFHSLIAGNTANDGSFVWTVDPTVQGNSEFTIRIRSLTNNIAAEDFSDAPFTLNSTTFPARGVMPKGWYRPTGSAGGWSVTSSPAYEGNRSLMSNRVGDGQSAGVAYRARFKEGLVGFFIRVASEKDYDVAHFYIDNVPQTLTRDGTTVGLSGFVNWTYVSFYVPAGFHTFKWTYEKDDAYSELIDKAWIDAVSFPPLEESEVSLDPKSAALPSWSIAEFAATGFTNTSSITSAEHTALLTSGDSPLRQRAISVEIIDGRRYLALTVAKPPGGRILGTVEVSSNLMDWYSGKNHTTTVLDSPTMLKVRDKTPTSPAAKRYIRLK